MLQEGLPYTIISQNSPRALSVSNNPDDPFVVGREPDGSDNQKWIITRGGNGAYVLKNVANEKYLGVEGEPRAGAKLVGVNFLMPWKIDPEDPGSFWILIGGSELLVSLSPIPLPPPIPVPATLQDDRRQIWRIQLAEPL